MKAKKEADERSNLWTFIAYPESMAPDIWVKLESYKLEYLISPLHDADVNGDSTEKKEHYHIILQFSSLKSYNQVKKITDDLLCTIPKKVWNKRSIIRYLIHQDNPEKAQYKIDDIKHGGGIEYLWAFDVSRTQKYQIIGEILDFIDANDIIEFTELVQFARVEKFNDWFPVLIDGNTFFINSYLTSKRHSRQDLEK